MNLLYVDHGYEIQCIIQADKTNKFTGYGKTNAAARMDLIRVVKENISSAKRTVKDAEREVINAQVVVKKLEAVLDLVKAGSTT